MKGPRGGLLWTVTGQDATPTCEHRPGSRKGGRMWRQGENPGGRQKGGRAWGGSQTGEGLTCQHEELGLESIGSGRPRKALEQRREVSRASGGRGWRGWMWWAGAQGGSCRSGRPDPGGRWWAGGRQGGHVPRTLSRGTVRSSGVEAGGKSQKKRHLRMSATLLMRNQNSRPPSGLGSRWSLVAPASLSLLPSPPAPPRCPPSPFLLPSAFPYCAEAPHWIQIPEEHLAFCLACVSFSFFSTLLDPPEPTLLEETLELN